MVNMPPGDVLGVYDTTAFQFAEDEHNTELRRQRKEFESNSLVRATHTSRRGRFRGGKPTHP